MKSDFIAIVKGPTVLVIVVMNTISILNVYYYGLDSRVL